MTIMRFYLILKGNLSLIYKYFQLGAISSIYLLRTLFPSQFKFFFSSGSYLHFGLFKNLCKYNKFKSFFEELFINQASHKKR